MSLQPVDVQRIFMRPVPQKPVRGFSFRALLSGLPARSGEMGIFFYPAPAERSASRSACYEQAVSVGPVVFPAWCRKTAPRLSDESIGGRGAVVFYAFRAWCSKHLLRAVRLKFSCSRWIFLRGRSEADQLTHNQQAAGSSPAPATNLAKPGFFVRAGRDARLDLKRQIWRRPFFAECFRVYLSRGGVQ